MPLPTKGVIAALWTPIDRSGKLLSTELAAHVRFLRQHGIHGMMVLGSTGGFPLLSVNQRKEVLAVARSHAPDLPSMANISDTRPEVVADLGRFARALGYGSISLLPPWFYSYDQEDLAEFLVRGAEAAGLPVFLYNFPERTGNRLDLQTIASVANRVPVAGVKQSGSDFEYHRELVALGRQKKFVVLTGADTRLPEAMELGVTGVVSGLSNAVPDLLVKLYQAVVDKKLPTVTRLGRRLAEIAAGIARVKFPADVAAVMEARRLPVGYSKTIQSPASRKRYEAAVTRTRTRFERWKLA